MTAGTDPRLRSHAIAKAGALALITLGVAALVLIVGVPDSQAVRTQVAAAGPWGPVVFVFLYSGVALTPWPRALLTVVGGGLFGLWAGAGLALAGALIGATISFSVTRHLGRGTGQRARSRYAINVARRLQNHGLATMLLLRMAPMIPFAAVNYGAGLSSVRVRHFILGSTIGMVPGTLFYTAMGTYGF